MKRIELPLNTWGYFDFISDDERLVLIDWANDNFSKTKNNGNGRYFIPKVNEWPNLPKEYMLVKQRIIDTDRLNYIIDPTFGDFLSFNLEGGNIHKHTDPNSTGRTHTRYNLLLSVPDEGGQPIYGGEYKIDYEEKFIWRCEAGKHTHESLPVVGTKPRINISFGFQI